ncbi:DNA methyltransferase, partial [Salmonella enterica]|uniref:DNA methyltransferase n=1 Tax=Salmonella enterica TaxID=28901 RepID=UPI002648B727
MCIRDRFNRSTWLTFMKNRLEVAKEMLSDDGFIFIQCDDNESAYLKVLCDSIFGEENYRNSIYWHRTYAGKTVKSKLPWNTDTILFYSKKETSLLEPYTAELSAADIKSYNKDDFDGRGKY